MLHSPSIETRAVQTWASCADRLPELRATRATLRELQVCDAPSILSMLSEPEVRRFVSDQPDTLEDGKFVDSTHRGRQAGRHLCGGIVPAGSSTAVGLFQVMAMKPSGRTAEWGFVHGRPLWGKVLFHIVWGDRIVCSDLTCGNSVLRD